jgi:hypothetical protein
MAPPAALLYSIALCLLIAIQGTIMIQLRSLHLLLIAAWVGVTTCATTPTFAQQIQIPTLQVCNDTKLAANNAVVIVETRKSPSFTGFFSLRGTLECVPTSGIVYPTGTLGIFGINMNDSHILGDVTFTTFDQVTSGGRATPTMWVSGQCKAANVKGCHYWLMAANNAQGHPVGKTFDVVSFLILDETGKRVAYGTGNVVDGDLTISSAN